NPINESVASLVTKVVEVVDEPVSTIPRSFASLVTNEVVTNVYSRFGFSLYGYFVGKRVAFPVVKYYVKNAWKKADRELNEDMVFVIPNVEDDGEVLHTVMVEYEWEPPRCVVCMEHMAWQTDYCIMEEGMSILRGWKSVPGMNSSEREMEKTYYSAFT
nr:zinc knuckle CX2CX4HX4C [Tanacetum cinerariifolium]